PRLPMLARLACLALAARVVAESGAAASPIQRATRSCAAPKYPGAGYFTGKIKATGVTCTYAKSFVPAYYKCRTNSGRNPAGRCRTRGREFRSTEVRESIPTESDAPVTWQ